MKKLINEDKNGAYLWVRQDFLKDFVLKENNPGFDVYDSRNGNSRYIVAKTSRLPDDNDLSTRHYGINFHRARPDLAAAKSYDDEITKANLNIRGLNSWAFSAATKEEYDVKSAVWGKFYAYVWDKTPQNLWITPHSGDVIRKPDDTFPYPKLELDGYVSGVAARCAFNDINPAAKRTMMSIHSHNWFSAVVDLGDFGINDVKKMEAVAEKVEAKYADRVQCAAEGCRRDFADRVMPWLEIIQRNRGTLDPKELQKEYSIDSYAVFFAALGLRLYQKEITRFTLKEFQDAISSLKGTKIRVASCSHLFSGRQIGKQLELAKQIQYGRMRNALQVECMKFYLKQEPELVADIILDVKHELFDK